jgi:predicted ester cyclase
MAERTPLEVVEALMSEVADGNLPALDDLLAEDMVNHAAGPQGRDGLKDILAVIAMDLGDPRVDTHHLFAHDDLVIHHMTLRGVHRASTMPLLEGVPPTDKPVSWTFIHIWRVVDGKVVEHWACRDDLGLLHQLGAWLPQR